MLLYQEVSTYSRRTRSISTKSRRGCSVDNRGTADTDSSFDLVASAANEPSGEMLVSIAIQLPRSVDPFVCPQSTAKEEVASYSCIDPDGRETVQDNTASSIGNSINLRIMTDSFVRLVLTGLTLNQFVSPTALIGSCN